jgi:hypothetical protein
MNELCNTSASRTTSICTHRHTVLKARQNRILQFVLVQQTFEHIFCEKMEVRIRRRPCGVRGQRQTSLKDQTTQCLTYAL